MKFIAPILAGVALTLGAATASAGSIEDKGEARLARMLDGRVAGYQAEIDRHYGLS